MKKRYYFRCLLILVISSMTMVMGNAQSISISKATDIGVRFFEQATAKSPRYAPARIIEESTVTAQALRHLEQNVCTLSVCPIVVGSWYREMNE